MGYSSFGAESAKSGYARAVHLYKEITEKALQNENAASGRPD